MKYVIAFVASVLIASPLAAQERLMLNGLPLREALTRTTLADSIDPEALAAASAVEKPVPMVMSPSFWIMAGALEGATVADLKSTFSVLGRCPACSEGNPIMKPFINAGPGVAYSAVTALNVGMMYLSAKAKKEHSKIWWLGPVVGTAVHSWAYYHNSHLR